MTSRRLLSKLTLLGAGMLAVLVLVGVPGLGQSAIEPEGEIASADCYGHHKQEGFRSMDLIPTVLSQVPRGETFDFQLTIRNPWLHELHDVYAYVNTSSAPGIGFPGEKEPTLLSEEGSIASAGPNSYSKLTYQLQVDANATDMFVGVAGEAGQASGLPNPGDLPVGNDFDLRLTSPNGQIVLDGPDHHENEPGGPGAPTTPTASELIRVPPEALTLGGMGEWSIELSYRGASDPAAFELSGGVYYNLSQSTQLILPGPALLGPGEEHTFSFQLVAKDASETQALRYGGLALAHHEHTDRNIGDDGTYDKWNSFTFTMGETLVVGQFSGVGGAPDLLSPILKRWGQVLGFAASFLIIPSLVFGGTFGRGSVLWLNRALGTPRRRVLFHNSLSFWLLAVSVLHLALFLYESFWNWSHGLVWGGLSLACMVGLGVTGATQRSFVAKWGFARWRFVHFAMGILVFVFVLIHMVADGSHLSFARAWFGATK